MKFFSFKIEGRYQERLDIGNWIMARLFPILWKEADKRIRKVNDALNEDFDEGKYVFAYRGGPRAWQMVAAVNAKENISAHRLQELLAIPLKERGGMADITVADLQEITVKEFRKALHKADESDLLEECRRFLMGMQIDFFENCRFKLREEIERDAAVTEEEAVTRAREILADQTLLDELKRIYSDENVDSFYGHPVHYKIVAGSQDAAMIIVRLLVEALHSRGRLLGRRISLISEIEEGCFDESEMQSVFQQAAGTTLVLELRGSAEEHENYATAYERVAEYIAKLVEKYNRKVLCVFIERTDNPGFTPSLMSRVEEYIDVVEIMEGAGDRKDAETYIRRLVEEADFEVMDDMEIGEALGEKNSFTSSDLHRIYDSFYKNGLKNKLYRAYKTANCVAVKKKDPLCDAYARLQKMVGLFEIKRIVDQVIAAHKVQKMRMSMGLTKQTNALHMLFTGNPGSAKTSVARLLADILKKEGVLKSGVFVECGRGDIVGRFVGWTAPQVQQKFRQARGGILFIDEAYSLVDGRDGCYGDEAISTIVQEMENHRDDVIVIFAGYTDKMKGFLMKNEGLRSRIAFHLDFPDYNADELTEIISLLAEERGFALGVSTRLKCRAIFADACKRKDFGNGRFARNLLEQAILKQSQRIMRENEGHEVSRDGLLTLVPEDFEVNVSQYARDERLIGFCG